METKSQRQPASFTGIEPVKAAAAKGGVMFRTRTLVGGMTLMLALGFLLITPAAKAGNSNVSQKRTTVTFSQPFEIPGDQTLPAGTYVFKIVDSTVHQGWVQISNADETHVYAMLHAIPSERVHLGDITTINFEETGAGFPTALRNWYHPGEQDGHEFVYRNE